MGVIDKRYGYGYGNDCYQNADGTVSCYRSAWDSWVRWLVLALIVGGAILLFVLFSCITSRRRRKQGYSPYRGTGWALGRTPPGHGAAQYNNAQPYYQNQNQQPYYNNSNNAPPAYNATENNQGYYGNAGVTQPGATYNGQYAPPKDPPPGRY